VEGECLAFPSDLFSEKLTCLNKTAHRFQERRTFTSCSLSQVGRTDDLYRREVSLYQSHILEDEFILILIFHFSYEYLFRWCFKQDATMQLEVRLTGILNTYTSAIGEEVSAFGTLVAPQVQAHHHQHLFSLRVDPMIEYVDFRIFQRIHH